MRKVIIAIIVIGVITVAGYAVMQFGGFLPGDESAQATPEAAAQSGADGQQEASSPVFATGSVVVDARVVPATAADLSFPVGGIVDQVLVEEGDTVAAGDVLVRLNAAQQRTAVSRAEAEVRRAQARYDELKAGPRIQEIDSARAALSAAEARLLRVQAGSLPGETAAAEAALAGAQAGLDKVLEGASEEQAITARAQLANAEAALRQAQSAYDRVKWRQEIGALPESAALEQATNNFEAARAQLEELERGPTAADLDGARAQVSQARAQVDLLSAALPADVLAAKAEADRLRSQLELLEAGARTEQLAVAEADVAAATAALQQALVSLADTELRAPFAGTVALINLSEGEQATPGQVAARMADLSSWEVRTEDLTEFEVVDVAPGDPVAITFDAIPDLELPGRVSRIRPIGADQRGDIVYTVVIIPEAEDDRLRWNMTAVATFE